MTTTALNLSRVGHAYLGRMMLEGIDLTIETGEILALVGPSGCGKSSLAHVAIGITEALEGHVTRGYARHAMVFQEPRLLPWATAWDNIAYPLRLAAVARGKRADLVARAAQKAALLPEDLQKYPSELSGGMRQRAAIARALVLDPDFMFFDEPFSALDVALKRRMQDLVIDTAARQNLSGLFITHDLTEAARIAHRIAVMDTNGKGILGTRALAGRPGERSDAQLFDFVQKARKSDPLFAHIHDVDERAIQ